MKIFNKILFLSLISIASSYAMQNKAQFSNKKKHTITLISSNNTAFYLEKDIAYFFDYFKKNKHIDGFYLNIDSKNVHHCINIMTIIYNDKKDKEHRNNTRINYLTTNKVREYIHKNIKDKSNNLPNMINALFIFLYTDTNEHSQTNYYYVFDEVVDMYLRKITRKIKGNNQHEKIKTIIEKTFKDKNLQLKVYLSYAARFLNK